MFKIVFISFLVLWFISYLFARKEKQTGVQASEEKLAFLGLGWISWIALCILWVILLIIF